MLIHELYSEIGLIHFIFPVAVGGYIAYDAKVRGNNFVGWGIGSILLTVPVAPAYFAKRNLRDGEFREGGFTWNFCKYFAVIWSIFAVIAIGELLFDMASIEEGVDDAAFEVAGVELMVEGGIWVFGLVVASMVGFLGKKNTVVEEGPAGSLAKSLADVEASAVLVTN